MWVLSGSAGTWSRYWLQQRTSSRDVCLRPAICGGFPLHYRLIDGKPISEDLLMTRIAIVGGGIASFVAAITLRERLPNAAITLYSRRE